MSRTVIGRGLAAIAALAALAVLAGFPAAGAQEPTPGTFGEVLDVRVINLEVVVTDRQNVRVPGLGPADFRLLIDGEEVAVEYFTEVRGGEAVEVAAETPGIQNVPALVPGTPVGTSYLVFVDDYFSIARDRDRALRTLAAETSALGPQDRLAIVAFDGRKLAMLSSWSPPGPQLDRAFQDAMRRPSYGLQRLAERQQADRDSRLRGRSVSVTRGLDARLDPLELDYAERLADQVRNSIDAAAATLRAFANPPGRKVMLLLCGGWPFSPAEYATADRFRTVNEPGLPRGVDLYAPLADTANRLGYTAYPVDLPGIDTSGSDAAFESGEIAEFNLNAGLAREDETRFTLTHVAGETGGRALFNTTAVLTRVADDTRSYYWLGFSPPRQGSDRDYRVEVEVKRPGLRVRSRRGFEEVSRQREVTMAVESALLFGSPPSTRPLDVTLGAPDKKSGRTVRVPVVLDIPADAVTFVPMGDQFQADLEIRVAAMDERGHRSSIPVIPYVVSARRQPVKGEIMRKDTVLELRREKQQIVVAVYDKAGGNLFSTTIQFTP